MKKKTINAVLAKKFEDFIKSIEDEKVQKLVKENSIITGGCIASMFLKEKVNDFDVYFTNKETVLAVAHYYVHKFKSNRKKDDNDTGVEVPISVLEDEDGRVKLVIKSAGIAAEDKGSNYQYFEQHPEEVGTEYIDNVVSVFKEADNNEKPRYRPLFLSANAITLSDKIQLVLRFYGEAKEIHDNYDFVHCTNYWESKTKKLVTNIDALESLLSKELQYIGSKYPIASLIRIRKFINRQWTINAGQILKIAHQTSNLDLTNIATLEDQLIGVDVAYFNELIDALKAHSDKEKEAGRTFTVDFGYLATIIDRIF
ncbi:MAG: hypothetical protein U0T69_11310 [Chitinophagales bacterium]